MSKQRKFVEQEFAGLATVIEEHRGEEGYYVVAATFQTVKMALVVAERMEKDYGIVVGVRS